MTVGILFNPVKPIIAVKLSTSALGMSPVVLCFYVCLLEEMSFVLSLPSVMAKSNISDIICKLIVSIL